MAPYGIKGSEAQSVGWKIVGRPTRAQISVERVTADGTGWVPPLRVRADERTCLLDAASR